MTSQSNADLVRSLQGLLEALPEESLAEINQLVIDNTETWEPQPGPQSDAYHSPADILFYGGQAGGGKTDLVIGLSQSQHYKSGIFRSKGVEHTDIISRSKSLARMKGKFAFNGQDNIMVTNDDRQVEFLSCKDSGSEIDLQGRVHDLKAFDEITHFLESQFRFLMGWNRPHENHSEARCRIVCTGNPPTDPVEGQWVKEFWAPWLDANHPNPAEPGELRWYARFKGHDYDTPVDSGDPIADPGTGKTVKPKSRTFIPSGISDNMYLAGTDYEATLQALPEPLRSQMLEGDFTAGVDDNARQVLPSSWVQAAMDRWVELPPKERGPMDSVGVDVARGKETGVLKGDKTCISTRHGGWFDKVQSYPGSATPTGAAGAALVMQNLRDQAPIHVDVIGVGTSVYDHLHENGLQTLGINNASKSYFRDKGGNLAMRNMRAELYWQMREALDPSSDSWIALPNDPELKADLCCAMWKLTQGGVLVESKDDIIKRLGRSPDKGDAVLLANIVTLKESDYEEDFDYSDDDKSTVTGY